MQEKTDICVYPSKSELSDGEITGRKIDEDHVVTDLPYILPWDKESVLAAETLEKRFVPGRDNPEHSAVTCQSEINETAESLAVRNVHDLLISQFAKSQFVHIK